MSKQFQSLKNQVHETASETAPSVFSKSRKLDMLSPVERYIKNKEDELKMKTEEVMEKTNE